MAIRTDLKVAVCDHCKTLEVIRYSRHNLLPAGWRYVVWASYGSVGAARNDSNKTLKVLLLGAPCRLILGRPEFFHFCSLECESLYLAGFDKIFVSGEEDAYRRFMDGESN